MRPWYSNCENKKSTSEVGHSDLLSVNAPSFAQMSVSVENLNGFWSRLIRMVPGLNYFKFMQMDYPRWPQGAVTAYKNSLNRKMTIS